MNTLLVFALLVACVEGAALVPYVPPLVYVHLPKCGSVLAATLLLFACPFDLYNYSGPTESFYEPELFFSLPGNAACQGNLERMLGGHHGVPVSMNPAGVVMMMRQPLARVASGFLHGFHDCPSMARLVPALNTSLIHQYGACVRGLVTVMLGYGFTPGHQRPLRRRQCLFRGPDGKLRLQHPAPPYNALWRRAGARHADCRIPRRRPRTGR